MTAPLTTHYFTFGVQYAHEPHPSATEDMPIHPDGWWEVKASSYGLAGVVVHALTGGKWAFGYTGLGTERGQLDPSYHPLGCIYRVEIRGGDPR